MNQSLSNLPGASNNALTEALPDTQSTNAVERASTSAMLEPTAQASLTCLDSPNSLESSPSGENLSANALAARMLGTFADMLIKAHLIEWAVVSGKGGRSGWVLFFPAANWARDGEELVPTPQKSTAVQAC